MQIDPIGVIHSPYKEKFGIPRQPGLVAGVEMALTLTGAWATPEAVAGLDDFSHIWLIFGFHQCQEQGWRASVRPPRLGGNKRMGMFATRTMFRPNHLGLSLARLVRVRCDDHSVVLTLGGLDLLDQTPVFDIKPYLPYAEAIPTATAGPFQHAPAALVRVRFSGLAEERVVTLQHHIPQLRQVIESVLQQDPRPAYQRELGREYGMRLYDLNIRWVVDSEGFVVTQLESVGEELAGAACS